MEIAEPAIRHSVVVIRVAPTAQSTLGVGVLPPRRFIEIRCIYEVIRIINAKKGNINDRWSNSSMATLQYIRIYLSVSFRKPVCTTCAREGSIRSNVSRKEYVQSQVVSIRFFKVPEYSGPCGGTIYLRKKELEPPTS